MKNYVKKAVQPMFAWSEDTDMNGVSVSQADMDSGSPKLGDMIAVNPKNPKDKWLIAKDFFEDNYEAEKAPGPKLDLGPTIIAYRFQGHEDQLPSLCFCIEKTNDNLVYLDGYDVIIGDVVVFVDGLSEVGYVLKENFNSLTMEAEILSFFNTDKASVLFVSESDSVDIRSGKASLDDFSDRIASISHNGSANRKSLHNTTANGARKNVKDIQFWGDGDMFKLISKASSEEEGWMKSTKAMQVDGVGCVVQVTTQQRNPDGSYEVAEAVTFVPGAIIEEIPGEENKIEGRRLVGLS